MAFKGSTRRCATLAVCFLLLLGSLENASSQGVVGGIVQSVVEPVAEIIPILPGLLSQLSPLASPLNGILQQAIVKNDVTQFTSDITTLLTGMVGVLLNNTLEPTPPPIRPDDDARSFGFRAENHIVTTEDGYRLEMFRIQDPRCNRTRGVIVMPPSFLANAGVWVLIGENSLAYRFARECYDVWLFSYRGDLFGRSHVNLSTESQEFWDYNPYHWGRFDLPIQIDFVVEKTNSTQLQFVAYDTGATGFAFMNDIYGLRYQNLISSCSLMVPIMYQSQLSSPIFVATGFARDLLTLIGATTLHGDLNFFNPTVHPILYNLCGRLPLTCNYLFQLLAGPSEKIRYKAFPRGFRNILDDISVQTGNWIFQQVGHRRVMSYFDYGTAALNIQHYGQATPPIVFLNRTVIPCRIYSAGRSTTTEPLDNLDSFNDLAPSAQRSYFEFTEYNSIGPDFPLDDAYFYGIIVADVKNDTDTFNK